MAERITKVKECDNGLCRRRKGVVKITLVLIGSDGMEFRTGGELCPAHVLMVKRFMDNMFDNKKEYDNESAE